MINQTSGFKPSCHQAGLESFLSLVKRFDLDARLIVWSPDPSWSQLQQDRYLVNWGGNAAWVIPAIATPGRHMGMCAGVSAKSDGIHYVAHQTNGKETVKYDEFSFLYESVLFAQVRGLKRNKAPKLIVLTMQHPGWELKLEKELQKLTPVEYTTQVVVQWDAIEDVLVL